MMTKAASKRQTKRTPASEAPASMSPDPEAIALAAYYRAERRGFAPGAELSDWLEAERELSQRSSRL